MSWRESVRWLGPCVPHTMRRALPLLLSLAAGCGAAASDDAESAEEEILKGQQASDPSLNAVGGLVEVFHMAQGDAYKPFCTGTLIAPSLVLTAEHCVIAMRPTAEYGFAIGADASKDFAGRRGPTRLIKLKAPRSESTVTGGGLGLGSDVAVVSLETPIADITPLAVAVLGPRDIGKKLTAVGYGEADDGSTGRRRIGQVTVRALEGRILPVAAGSLARYHELAQGDPVVDRADYETLTLLKDYEALTGGAPKDVQLCGGDSGGPLLRVTRDGTKTVYGVASWVLFTPAAPCTLGSVYATFGPKTMQFINAERDR